MNDKVDPRVKFEMVLSTEKFKLQRSHESTTLSVKEELDEAAAQGRPLDMTAIRYLTKRMTKTEVEIDACEYILHRLDRHRDYDLEKFTIDLQHEVISGLVTSHHEQQRALYVAAAEHLRNFKYM